MSQTEGPDIESAMSDVMEIPDVTVAWSIRLPDGQVLEHRANEMMEAGSTFKAIVAAETCRQVEEGRIDWADELVIRPEDRVPASAALENLADGATVPLDEAVRIMLSHSDNTATDLVLGTVGHGSIVRLAESLGLSDMTIPVSTKELYARPEHEQGDAFTTTMSDLRRFYDAIFKKALFVDTETHDRMLEFLHAEDQLQGTNWPNGVTCYRKSGSFESELLVAQAIAGTFSKDGRVATFAMSANQRPGALDALEATYTAFAVGFGKTLKVVTETFIQIP